MRNIKFKVHIWKIIILYWNTSFCSYFFHVYSHFSELLSHVNMFEGWMNRSCVCPQFRVKILLLCLIIRHLHNNLNYSLYLFRILSIMKLLLLRLGHYCNRHHLLALRRFSSAPKICIVGSGPASFYTAQHLIKVWDTVRTLMRVMLDCTLIFNQTKELPYEHLVCMLTGFQKKSLPDLFSIICMAWLVVCSIPWMNSLVQ